MMQTEQSERSSFVPGWKPQRLPVTLIGFEDSLATRVAENLDALGCEAICADGPSELPRRGVVFVSGDDASFLATIREIRRVDASIFIAVVTQAPAVEKWLDGLDAGANDYYNLPLDGWSLHFLLRQAFEPLAPGSA